MKGYKILLDDTWHIIILFVRPPRDSPLWLVRRVTSSTDFTQYQRVCVALDYIRCDNLVWQNVTSVTRSDVVILQVYSCHDHIFFLFGPCDFSDIPSPNWTFGFRTALGLGLTQRSLIKDILTVSSECLFGCLGNFVASFTSSILHI